MRLVFLKCSGEKVRILDIAFYEPSPPRGATVASHEIVVDDRLNAFRCKKFAGMTADKSGSPGYKHTVTSHNASPNRMMRFHEYAFIKAKSFAVAFRQLSARISHRYTFRDLGRKRRLGSVFSVVCQ